MYSALFPGVSIRSMRNSDGVVKAVQGLRETQGLHDVEAIGLIDRDDRTDDEVANLQAEGIYALRTNSVESLYYCQDSMTAVAEWQSLSLAGIPQIKPPFLDIAPAGIPPNIIPHSKGVKCGLMRPDSLKVPAFIGQPLYCQA